MAKGVKTGGRVKGTPNKTTAMVKDAIALAAEQLGGTDRLVEWVKEDPLNERAFWKDIYPKLLPLQVANADDEEFKVSQIVRRVVDPRES